MDGDGPGQLERKLAPGGLVLSIVFPVFRLSARVARWSQRQSSWAGRDVRRKVSKVVRTTEQHRSDDDRRVAAHEFDQGQWPKIDVGSDGSVTERTRALAQIRR